MTRYTGVIVGVDKDLTQHEAQTMLEMLRNIFPGVRFAVAEHAQSVTFAAEDPQDVIG